MMMGGPNPLLTSSLRKLLQPLPPSAPAPLPQASTFHYPHTCCLDLLHVQPAGDGIKYRKQPAEAGKQVGEAASA